MSEWKKVKIGDFLKRKRIPIQLEADKEYKLITIKLYHKGVFLRGNKKGSEIHSNMYKVSKGDFILSGIDARNGAFGIVPDSLDGAIVTNDFWYFDIDELIIKKEFFLWLTSTPVFLDVCQKASMGETQRIRLQKDAFFNYQIKCPSIEYQDEFLARINPIIEKIKIIQSETEKQTEYAKLLRQNILQEAIEGKLTADWRKQNPVKKGNPDYDAEALFEQIQKERNNEKKQKELSPFAGDVKPFELPIGWKWVKLGNIVENITSGSREWAKYYSNKGAIFLRMGNLSRDSYKLRLEKLQYVCVPETTEGKRTRLVPFDLLFSITAEIGNLGLIPENFPEAYINQHTARIRFVDSIKQTLFFANSLLAPAIRKQYMPNAHGMKNSFRLDTLSYLMVPLPPLAEQREIVAQVEKHLQNVSDLENQITEREQLTKQLFQSILKEAFEEG